MKKIIPTLIALVLIIGLGVISGQRAGYRIILEERGFSIGKPKTTNEIISENARNSFVRVSEGDTLQTFNYTEAGVTTLVTGIEYGTFICDMRGMQLSQNLNINSDLFTYIKDTRTDYSSGALAFDDDYNLIIEGSSDSTAVDVNTLYQDVFTGIKTGNDVDIILEDYYIEQENTDERQNMLDSIERYNNFHIVYTNGFDLSSKVLARRGLVDLNDDGTYSIDVEVSTCRDIAGRNLTGYNTIGLERDFITHDGRNIRVKSETFGYYIDYQAEGEYILDAITNSKSEVDRQPIFKQEEEHPFESTYVELDKANQHFYYYVDGKLILDSDVVTGLPTRDRDTPTGVYFIINKAREANLVGETWDVDVEYWLGVTYNGIGFHDASWRNRFGGTIYKNNGSHGCINTPSEVMKEFYETVETGTAVIIY